MDSAHAHSSPRPKEPQTYNSSVSRGTWFHYLYGYKDESLSLTTTKRKHLLSTALKKAFSRPGSPGR
eukprot:440379-Ditylum_brightwellii.AAC.2